MTDSLKGILFRKSMHGLYIGALMFLGVIVSGVVAYSLEGWKLSDAIYMVIITVFSVGYEEVEPVSTPMLRAITMLIIVAGDASKVYFVGSLVRFITEGEIGKAMEEHRKSREIESISGHAVICGYGRIGQVLARDLARKRFPFLVIDNNAERVALAHTHGWQALIGDAGDEGTLSEAHLERAVVLATVLPNDMVNVFITLTARNMRPDLRIIARAEDPATEKKLKQAGANEIILPAFVGGMQIANSITHPSLDSILQDGSRHLNNDLKELGVEIVEHSIVPNGVNDRKTVQQLLRGVESHCLVLAVKKPDGALLQHPPGNYRLEAGDVVVMLSHGRLV
ncbi:MAG: potassium channel family protein [Methylacidiphilales bacterium]|nr:potassium channel family protein [Candidatus Methylacidiphilales bacterium]